MCACKETDVRDTPNDSILAGGEGQGSRGETCHLHYCESPVSSMAEHPLLNKISTPILCADDTSVIVSESEPSTFRNMLNEVFKTLNIWFNTNLLSLKFTKTEYIIFTAKQFYEQDNRIKIAYGNKEIPDSCHI
jgi:hypothetical protein